jgi:hypothetical protein
MENSTTKCLVDSEAEHPLTGSMTTYREEGLGAAHKECVLATVTSARMAIQELLAAKEQLWVCAGCRSNYDHQAMLSSILACTDCGETQEWTLQAYCDMWVRGLLIKGMLGYDRERTTNPVNFAKLGEKMLSPHGRNIGLEYPDHGEIGEDATCACEATSLVDGTDFDGGITDKASDMDYTEMEASKSSEVADGIDSGSGNTDKGNDIVNVEMEADEVADLAPGANPLATTFVKSATPKAMLDLITGAYSQELLSTRLQGNAVKEALAISLLLQFRKTSPLEPLPAWMPPSLHALSEEVLQARLTFLSALASKPTLKERRGSDMTIHPGITFGILKRKLPAAKDESSSSERPAKKQRLFTTTPEEMVKIFAQYMQAQGARSGRSVQPARVMESIIERVEYSRKIGPGTASAPSGTEAIPSLMSVAVIAPAKEQVAVPTSNVPPLVVNNPPEVRNPMFDTMKPADAVTWRGGSAGRGRGRGHRGSSWGKAVVSNRLEEGPVRCPNEAPPGSFCGYPNYQEAAKCGRCGISNPYYKPLEPKVLPNHTKRGGDRGRGYRGRGQGFRSGRGRNY